MTIWSPRQTHDLVKPRSRPCHSGLSRIRGAPGHGLLHDWIRTRPGKATGISAIPGIRAESPFNLSIEMEMRTLTSLSGREWT